MTGTLLKQNAPIHGQERDSRSPKRPLQRVVRTRR